MTQLRTEIAAALSGRDCPRFTAVRAGGLGDTLLVLPALQLLLREWPTVEITLIGSAWAGRLRPLITFPLSLLRFDSPLLTPLFAPSCPKDETGAFARADAAVVYTSRSDDELVRNARRLCHGPVVVWPVQPPGGVHAAEHFARAVAQIPPIPDEPTGDAAKRRPLPTPSLRVPPRMLTWACDWLAARLSSSRRPVGVHPGSGGTRKCWPAERFARLIERLSGPIVLFEGPADAGPCARIEQSLPDRSSVLRASRLSIPEAAALLSQCRLYVGNDSGLTHLAGALGLPTVAVFGPTDPQVWRPLGSEVRVVRGETPGDQWPGVEQVAAACGALAP